MAATVATSGATSMALTASQTRSVRPRRSPNCNFAFSTIRAIFLTLVTSHPCRSTSPSSCSSSLAPVAAATLLATWSNAGLASAASASSVVASAASSRCAASPLMGSPLTGSRSTPTAVPYRAMPGPSPDSMTLCTPL